MSALAFVDETFSDTTNTSPGYYQLTAVLIDGSEVAACRSGVITIAPDGFHASPMANAGDVATVEAMLEHAAASAGWNFITVGTTAARKLEPLRQQCLKELLLELDRQKTSLVVLDSRLAVLGDPQARNKRDLATYEALRTTGRLDGSVRVRHQRNKDEAMLGLPDAVGWAYRRHHLNGDSGYWDRVAGVTTLITVV